MHARSACDARFAVERNPHDSDLELQRLMDAVSLDCRFGLATIGALLVVAGII
jgi:hypothetical protein